MKIRELKRVGFGGVAFIDASCGADEVWQGVVSVWSCDRDRWVEILLAPSQARRLATHLVKLADKAERKKP